MTALGFQRTAALRRLEQLVQPQLPTGAQVRRGVPREGLTGRLVALGDVLELETDVPTLKAGRRHYDDTFAVEVLCLAWEAGTATFDTVDEQSEGLGEVVRRVVADHPQLDADGAALAGVVSCTVTRAVGPNPWHTAEGVGSAMLLELTIATRIASEEEQP